MFKQIKPKRLKSDAMRLELLNAVRKSGRQVKKDFEKTVNTWKRKPEFVLLISLKGGPQFIVVTENEIYGYVDKGTKPHKIRPKKRGGRLAFQSTYSPKTRPGVIGSASGGSSGSRVYTQEVNHPGTKARRFEETIYKKWEKQFKRDMEKAMVRAAKKSGHAIK